VIEYFDTERGRFAVEITGPAEAPPIVLIAGLGDDHACWEPVLPYLTAEYRCVTFDNRGGARSPAGWTGTGRRDVTTIPPGAAAEQARPALSGTSRCRR
jgi:pimeloyl-ACP methyl ester carboxylesterase